MPTQRTTARASLRTSTTSPEEGPPSIVALWLVRATLRRAATPWRSGRRRFSGFDFEDDEISFEGRKPGKRASSAKLERERRALEARKLRRDGAAFRNVSLLGKALGLTVAEREVLAFLTMTKLDERLHRQTQPLLIGDVPRVCGEIAQVIDVPEALVRGALRAGSALREARVVDLSGREVNFGVSIGVPDPVLEVLCQEHETGDSLLAAFFHRAAAPTLEVADFAHAATLVEHLRLLLAGALAQKATGVNLLVHGAPGVGKTELARLLAKLVDAELYEIRSDDDDGDPLSGAKRLSAYGIAQRVLAQRPRSVVLFDEMEDAFASSPMAMLLDPARAAQGKAFRNRLLEQNARPTIWLSNRVEGFDPAFVRRFDLVLELRSPPAAARGRLLAAQLDGLGVGSTWIERAAADDRLSPAVGKRVARALRLAGDLPATRAEQLATDALDGVLEAQGPRRAYEPLRPTTYDLRFVNASADLAQLADGLARRPRATLCLQGPPGTGKTDYARWLAGRLGLPLISRRASDLLGKYVGENEANLARMFREARERHAVLLLDEADSFLRERGYAERTWEITMVNELLVQMEAFDGLFVCTTNLIEALDQASLRRFDAKIRFEPLTAPQRWALFEATLASLGSEIGGEDATLREGLGRLEGLTPGDFATVARRAGVFDERASAERLLGWLGEEQRAKAGGARRRVGFGG
jgi:SpoVK/Ycf46/Vps4 family AAA+-type ATPase